MIQRARSSFPLIGSGGGTHRNDNRRVEQEIALEDGKTARQDIGAGGQQGNEERKEAEHLLGEIGGASKEDLPELETIFLQEDVGGLRVMVWSALSLIIAVECADRCTLDGSTLARIIGQACC